MVTKTGAKRTLSDFFGIISEEEGQAMLDDLKRITRIDQFYYARLSHA